MRCATTAIWRPLGQRDLARRAAYYITLSAGGGDGEKCIDGTIWAQRDRGDRGGSFFFFFGHTHLPMDTLPRAISSFAEYISI